MKIQLLFLTASVLIFSGCGTDRVSVTGTVKFDDDTPLEIGVVKFIGEQTQATGRIQAGGKYRLGGIKENDGIKPGSYQVVVAGATTGGGSDGEQFVRFIDERYERANTSGLTCDVSGSTVFDITVTKPTKPEPPTPPRREVPALPTPTPASTPVAKS
ncbi:hypothetical protein FACS1894170_00730 [Planctomycetales bacterium]|nr:hypothetical protein FACS1894170_00730 [Planctomycetales bacterium]